MKLLQETKHELSVQNEDNAFGRSLYCFVYVMETVQQLPSERFQGNFVLSIKYNFVVASIDEY